MVSIRLRAYLAVRKIMKLGGFESDYTKRFYTVFILAFLVSFSLYIATEYYRATSVHSEEIFEVDAAMLLVGGIIMLVLFWITVCILSRTLRKLNLTSKSVNRRNIRYKLTTYFTVALTFPFVLGGVIDIIQILTKYDSATNTKYYFPTQYVGNFATVAEIILFSGTVGIVYYKRVFKLLQSGLSSGKSGDLASSEIHLPEVDIEPAISSDSTRTSANGDNFIQMEQ